MIFRIAEKRARQMFDRIGSYLKKGDSILDIGCGTAFIARLLKRKGYKITALDVKNRSWIKEIKPIVYDGKHMPFENDSFDVSLLITVLHHTKNPEEILKEATRISRRIIVVEDVYNSVFQKYLTFIMDSLVNFEFFGHPHSNKTENEWENTFKQLNLNIIDKKNFNFWAFFKGIVFYLEK